MRSSLQLNLPPTKVQSVSRARETAEPESGKELSRGEESRLTLLLADAVEAAQCSEKEAALAQGYEPTYWSRIKSGEKAAHLDRLSRLPEKVQREFVKRYAQELKMTVSDEDSRKRAVAELVKAAAHVLSEMAG